MSLSLARRPGPSRRHVLSGLAAIGGCACLPGRSGHAEEAAPSGRLIDLHHHHYPDAYLNASEDLAGTRNPAARAWSLAKTLDQMDRNNVTQAVLSLSNAGEVFSGDQQAARRLARICNESAAKLVQEHPGRFGFFATLPLLDPEGSLAEIAYALDTLKADGIGLFTSYGSKWPGDPAFAPVFEELDRRQALVFFHPHAPTCCADLLAGVTDNLIEFPQETARAVLSLLFSGTFAKRQNVRWLFSHAGGPIPTLSGRITTLTARLDRLAAIAPNGIDHELKRLHYETANAAYPAAMAALLAYVPISQIMFGTDYPFVSVDDNRQGLARIQLAPEQRIAIQSGNALRLLPQFAL